MVSGNVDYGPWAYWCKAHMSTWPHTGFVEKRNNECKDNLEKMYTATQVRKAWEEFANEAESTIVGSKPNGINRTFANICLNVVVKEARRRAKEW